MVHSGTLMSKSNPSLKDCEKDRARGKPCSLPGMVYEVQALLWTGTKTVFLISLDIRPRWWHIKPPSCLGHQNIFLWPLHRRCMLLSSVEMWFCCGRKGQWADSKTLPRQISSVCVLSHWEHTAVGQPGGVHEYRAHLLLLVRGRIFSPPQLFVQALTSEPVSCSINLASNLVVRAAWVSPVHPSSEGWCTEGTHWKNLIWSPWNSLILANALFYYYYSLIVFSRLGFS